MLFFIIVFLLSMYISFNIGRIYEMYSESECCEYEMNRECADIEESL